MDCSTDALINAARCQYSCIPVSMLRAIRSYLLCQWAKKKVTPPSSSFAYTPATATIQWTDSSGVHIGNLAAFNADPNRLTTTDLVMSFQAITSITGLNSLPLLTHLDCHTNSLTALDLTGCNALTYLRCDHNTITSLDVHTCPAIVTVICDHNTMTSLNVTGCIHLTTLFCGVNSLPSITGLNTCVALTSLDCDTNGLTVLDLHTAPNLAILDCSFNSLGTLTITGCFSISQMWTNNNPSLVVVGP